MNDHRISEIPVIKVNFLINNKRQTELTPSISFSVLRIGPYTLDHYEIRMHVFNATFYNITVLFMS